jgi:hypothetical protein
MAKKTSNSTSSVTTEQKKVNNPLEGYVVSGFLKRLGAQKFEFKGRDFSLSTIKPADLERLAADKDFKHLQKKG